MTELTTSETLNYAADLIEQRGWAIGNCGMNASEGAPLCLEGALGAAAGAALDDYGFGYPMYDYTAVEKTPAYASIRAYLAIADDREVFTWNDKQAEGSAVVEVLRACAVIEASREREVAEVTS